MGDIASPQNEDTFFAGRSAYREPLMVIWLPSLRNQIVSRADPDIDHAFSFRYTVVSSVADSPISFIGKKFVAPPKILISHQIYLARCLYSEVYPRFLYNT